LPGTSKNNLLAERRQEFGITGCQEAGSWHNILGHEGLPGKPLPRRLFRALFWLNLEILSFLQFPIFFAKYDHILLASL